MGAAFAASVTLVAAALTTPAAVVRPAPASAEATPSNPVTVERDYYVSVSLVEASERDGAGERWDSWSDSGPDIFVEIIWKDNRIYRSTTKRDTFVARWSTSELRLGDIALSGGHTSVDDLIQAARVHIRGGETIVVRVFDSDMVTNTLIGEKTFTLTDLREGETTYSFEGPGVVRLALQVRPLDQPVDLLH